VGHGLTTACSGRRCAPRLSASRHTDVCFESRRLLGHDLLWAKAATRNADTTLAHRERCSTIRFPLTIFTASSYDVQPHTMPDSGNSEVRTSGTKRPSRWASSATGASCRAQRSPRRADVRASGAAPPECSRPWTLSGTRCDRPFLANSAGITTGGSRGRCPATSREAVRPAVER
jgi:hypothetical protein